MTLHEVYKALGIEYKDISELMAMTQEERQKYFEDHCWSTKDAGPIDLNDHTQLEDGSIVFTTDFDLS